VHGLLRCCLTLLSTVCYLGSLPSSSSLFGCGSFQIGELQGAPIAAFPALPTDSGSFSQFPAYRLLYTQGPHFRLFQEPSCAPHAIALGRLSRLCCSAIIHPASEASASPSKKQCTPNVSIEALLHLSYEGGGVWRKKGEEP
jgi:hypothetical protein